MGTVRLRTVNKAFRFRRPGKLRDGDLELVLVSKYPGNAEKKHVPQYTFEMRRVGKGTVMGIIRLRIGSARTVRYCGHIGYGVRKRYRGHRYAACSSVLVMKLAARHGLKAVWLTVDPKNIPSQCTCAIIGAKYVETVRIPKDHQMYGEGARYRRRYRRPLTE
ncbi:GNAT family N-acetyltransferase [Verrucomicrobiota bacterium]